VNARNEAMAHAYRQLCEELSAALYEEDPASMGSAVGAPHDEYDGEAARLASKLRDVRSRDEILSHLRELFGTCSEPLAERVDKALAKFRLRTETARRTTD
jgi:hypothetical protein